MKDEKKWPWEIAMPEAEAIVERLKPCCERIAVAGSLRRLKRFVHDIEVVFVPKMSKRPDGLFDEKIISVADEVIEQLLKDGYFQKRPNKNGAFTWGEANKLAIHAASGIPVDLFACPPENWWVTLVVRTGSKETNLLLTTSANRRNLSLNAYGCGVTERMTGDVIRAISERDVFELCGVKYLEPKDR